MGNLISIALKALGNNKMRCFLTMLGIIIGVSSVIVMLAIGQGSKESIKEQVSEMGSNMIMIHPGNMKRGGVAQDASSMQSLKLKDYENLKEECEYISAISPVVNSSGQLIYGANNHPCSVNGCNEDYLEIRKYKINSGEMFTQEDIRTAAKVCVVGKTVVDKLFTDGEEPLGRTIRFGSIPLTIVGVLESKGYNSMGQDQDDCVIAPYTTIQKRVLAITHLQSIFASAISEELTDKATEEMTKILRRNHRIETDDTDLDDFEIRSQEELATMMSSMSDIMTILLSCVAGISLIVGGIGIMNIMYVSVTERTKEIGLRMSVGARGKDILFQFLVESIIISIAGGILGIVFGIAVSSFLAIFSTWRISISVFSIILSFLVCSIVGIFFGWYPAKKAARLNPIEAIRYE
ncbi:MAG TPA: ABC transporter permease [Candidatus Onthomorpha intestinigallinarum]|uniref:ABC transporter permease n=1 Tax=Candidatus Onthomorpha intestinigallinarum TaxID=2840880 RepID=A0A9D1RGW4_9BACT|nr:ABC transporter permease [Candidatus Onthomorpha intestinigallinarum]